MSNCDACVVSKFWEGLKFCGCGCPVEVLTVFRDVLQTMHDAVADKEDLESWTKAAVKRNEIFEGITAWEYLVYYVLDSAGLLEHVGSVPGWLDAKGEELLAAMAGKTNEELDGMVTHYCDHE